MALLIDEFFCNLKEFRRIAMQDGKTDRRGSAMFNLGVAGLRPA